MGSTRSETPYGTTESDLCGRNHLLCLTDSVSAPAQPERDLHLYDPFRNVSFRVNPT